MHLWDVSRSSVSKTSQRGLICKFLRRLLWEWSKAPHLKGSLRPLTFSQRHLWIASETVTLGLQTEGLFGYLFFYLRVHEHFTKLTWKIAQSLIRAKNLAGLFTLEENFFFRLNCISSLSLSFLDLIISNLLAFSYILLCFRRPFR